MLKKTMQTMFGLLFAVALVAPSKANAQVVVGVRPGARVAVGVTIGPAPYVVAPAPVVVAPAPYAVYGPGYVYSAPRVVVGYRGYPYRYGYGYYPYGRGYGWYGHGGGHYVRGWHR